MNEPNDVDLGIPANDFTRGQAFYDLVIEADANNTLYVGGIDIFRSTNGTTWTQISKWSNNNNLGALNVPLVHADQHALIFRPGTSDTEAIFGNDGGVYYSNNIASSVGNSNAIQSRNKDYNTVQFYYGTIDVVDSADGDDIAGGTQDNGTQFTLDATAGANAYFDPVSGDGGYTEIDDSGSYVITTYPGNNSIYINYPLFTSSLALTSLGGGSFINQAELDKNLDILYSNASSGGTNRIERVAEFLPGGLPQTNTALTNALMNSSPSALKVSPFTNSIYNFICRIEKWKVVKSKYC